MSLLRVLVCLAVLCVVPGLSQQQVQFPSQLEINVAIANRDTVDKALRCIEGFKCKLPYGALLRRAGPELITIGRCPRGMCTPDQEARARHLILRIQEKYPNRFRATLFRMANRRHSG